MAELIEPFNMHGPPPYGYRQAEYPNLYKWEVVEEEQHVINRIARMDADCMSLRKIAMQLEDEGIAGPKGNGWTHVHVRKILIRVREKNTKELESNTRATVNSNSRSLTDDFSPEIRQATGHATHEELADCVPCMSGLDDELEVLEVSISEISRPGTDTTPPDDMTELEQTGWTRADLVAIGYPDRDYTIDVIAPTIVNQGILRFGEEHGIDRLQICEFRDMGVPRDAQMSLENLSRTFKMVKSWIEKETAAETSDYFACVEWGVAVHGVGKSREQAEQDATNTIGEDWRDY